MSSFSSVVRKPGNSLKPKVQPRRGVPRRTIAAATSTFQDQSSQITDEVTARTPADSVNGISQSQSASKQSSDTSQTARSPSRAQQIQGNSQLRTSRSANNTASEIQNTAPESVQITLPDIAARDQVVASAHGQPTEQILSNTRLIVIPEENDTQTRAAEGPLEPPRKRRRTTPGLQTPSIAQIRTDNPSPNTTQLSQQSSQSQPSDLLQSATKQAASVSSLASEIETQTRAQSRRRNLSKNGLQPSDTLDTYTTLDVVPNQKPRKGRRKTVAEQVAEIIADAAQNTEDRHRERDQTPENAENYQLAPNETTMGELVKDRKLGKKSQLEEDMQRDWTDIVQRRKEAREFALDNAQKGRRKAFGHLADIPLQATVAIGPKTEIRNGKIVVIEESRQIDRNEALEQAAVLDAENVREDKFYYKRVNQSTVGVKANAGRRSKWNEESTEQFFRGLQMFGTDFLMIANLFPGVDRKQIKMKFIREENADKSKVMYALANRIPIDLDEYSKITETTLQNPEDVQAEIEAEEQRLKDEDQQRRIREGFASANAEDNPIPSTEENETAAAEGPPEGESRYAALAEDIMTPRNKRQRKAGSTLRKRGPKSARRPTEGVEEILGSIDEVRV